MAGQTGVRLIAISSIDWENYLKDVAALTGHSPISSIDSSNINWSNSAKYIISLGEFTGKIDPNISLKSSALLTHLFFSFLIESSASTLFTLMELTDLSTVTARRKHPRGRVAVVSGNLKQWKDAITTALSTKRNKEILWIFKECHQVLCSLGLAAIWHDYKKHTISNDTYLLEYKP